MTGDAQQHGPAAGGTEAGARTDAVAVVHIDDPQDLLGERVLANLSREAAAAMLEVGRGGEVRVRLVADAEMADAHLKYADVPGTTDVLTFDLAEDAAATGASAALDVDILVCVDEARRQAVIHGHAAEREVLLYILHGVLHCLGHDDHDDAAYERMHAEEDRILRAIGVGPVFDPARDGAVSLSGRPGR